MALGLPHFYLIVQARLSTQEVKFRIPPVPLRYPI